MQYRSVDVIPNISPTEFVLENLAYFVKQGSKKLLALLEYLIIRARVIIAHIVSKQLLPCLQNLIVADKFNINHVQRVDAGKPKRSTPINPQRVEYSLAPVPECLVSFELALHP